MADILGLPTRGEGVRATVEVDAGASNIQVGAACSIDAASTNRTLVVTDFAAAGGFFGIVCDYNPNSQTATVVTDGAGVPILHDGTTAPAATGQLFLSATGLATDNTGTPTNGAITVLDSPAIDGNNGGAEVSAVRADLARAQIVAPNTATFEASAQKRGNSKKSTEG